MKRYLDQILPKFNEGFVFRRKWKMEEKNGNGLAAADWCRRFCFLIVLLLVATLGNEPADGSAVPSESAGRFSQVGTF